MRDTCLILIIQITLLSYSYSLAGLFRKVKVKLYCALRRGNDRERHLFRRPQFDDSPLPLIDLGLGSYRQKFRKYQFKSKVDPADATWTNLCWVRRHRCARGSCVHGNSRFFSHSIPEMFS
jgi:hypothetical protein